VVSTCGTSEAPTVRPPRPTGPVPTRVVLRGHRSRLKKGALAKLIRWDAGISPAAAREQVERLLDGQPVTVDLPSAEAAEAFRGAAAACGAVLAEDQSSGSTG
jgi:hypothetical protein